jgi:uncharacterized protein YgbK (DUF1537 family)
MSHRLFAYYGDDFTGSTDALEALAGHGVPAVLFLDPPDERQLARFPGHRAIGIAGESRSRGPQWMDERLPAIFQALKSYGAPVCQYKVCSTFDSSPQHGSIGRALEIGQRIFDSSYVPVVVAAPHLRRYVLFGNLFAAAGSQVFRIDRHPAMRRHPVTPMDEADLRLHLARQTDRTVALLDLTALRGGRAREELDELLRLRPQAVVFDGLEDADLKTTGALLWPQRAGVQVFAVGSSGLTLAMVHHWRATGLIDADFLPAPASAADRLLALSGSCSPTTEAQIRWALANGFAGLHIDPRVPDDEDLLRAGVAALSAGRSVVLYTALGDADRVPGGGETLGRRLGLLLRELVLRSGVRRAVVAGGDTATHAIRQLGVYALTFMAPTAPGAPLCRAHSDHAPLDGLELALKGGQVGPYDYFDVVRRGMR